MSSMDSGWWNRIQWTNGWTKNPNGQRSWFFWLLILLLVLFVIWVFFGRRKYEFIGLQPRPRPINSSPEEPIDSEPGLEPFGISMVPDEVRLEPLNPRFSFPLVNLTSKSRSHSRSRSYSRTYSRSGERPVHLPLVALSPDEDLMEHYSNTSTSSLLPAYPIPFSRPPYRHPDPNRQWASLGEKITCEVMEEIYGVEFKTLRPDWLRNPETGRNLEIDCYNEEMKIGAEYNGKQHYVFPNGFSRSEDEFIKQVRRDQYKLNVCDQQGVYIITVPYTIPYSEIRSYIIQNLPVTG